MEGGRERWGEEGERDGERKDIRRGCLLIGLDAGECSDIVAGNVSLSASLERSGQPPVTITVVDYLEVLT